MTGIVDYNAGNIKSVERALAYSGERFVTGRSPRELEKCERLIVPGVGDAAYAMRSLRASGFDSFLKERAAALMPILGICLGSQIIFERSDEGDTECLGLVKGSVRRLEDLWKEKNIDARELKIPHMGWNDIAFENGSSCLFDGVPDRSNFYFVHSYVICPADQSVVKASADYGAKIPAAVSFGCVSTFQFHPEKSGANGLKILKNFCEKSSGGGDA